MTAVDFTVLSIAPEPFAVTPNLIARMRIAESTGATVHALVLR